MDSMKGLTGLAFKYPELRYYRGSKLTIPVHVKKAIFLTTEVSIN